jgi:hypothetical protein
VSRTEKTQPYWVKRFEWYREVHNHVKGYCNLPSSPREQGSDWAHDWRSDCYYDCDWNHRIYRCPCPLCSQRDWHRRELRAARYEGKRQARDWWREY